MNIKFTIQKPSLYHLILAGIGSFIYKDQAILDAPQRIDKYRLTQKIKKENPFRSYALGIYMYKKQKYFIKTWNGKRRSFCYYSLVNEYFISKTLSKLLKADSLTSFPLRVPSAIGYHRSDKSLSIVFEYIEGTSLSRFPISFQAKKITHILRELQVISQQITHEDRKLIKVRDVYSYLTSLPFFMLALLRYDRMRCKETLFSLSFFIKYALEQRKEKLILAHGDLNPDNVYVTKNSIYLLDVEHAMLTLPHYDICYLSLIKENKQLVSVLNKSGFLQRQRSALQKFISLQRASVINPATGRQHFSSLQTDI